MQSSSADCINLRINTDASFRAEKSSVVGIVARIQQALLFKPMVLLWGLSYCRSLQREVESDEPNVNHRAGEKLFLCCTGTLTAMKDGQATSRVRSLG